MREACTRVLMVVALCFVAVACSVPSLTPRDAAPDTGGQMEAVDRDMAEEPPAATPVATPSISGSFAVLIVDELGRPAPGIPAEISGPESFLKRSDAEGRIRFTGPAGTYRVSVLVGCHDDVLVLRAGSGTAGIVRGQEGEGRIEVDWQRRVGPQGPSFASYAPDWPVGREIRLRFDVVDRCTSERIPGGGLDGYTFVTGPTITLVGEPHMRADDDGYGWVTFVCEEAGEATLEVVDGRNPRDRLDLGDAERTGARSPACIDL